MFRQLFLKQSFAQIKFKRASTVKPIVSIAQVVNNTLS